MTSWNSWLPNSSVPHTTTETVNRHHPEHPFQKCGRFLGVLRVRKGLSRKELISRLLEKIDEDDPFLERISESLLKRVEVGQVVKLNRKMVEVFVQALNCTSSERFQLLVLADLNPFADSQGGMDAVDKALTQVFFLLRERSIVRHLIASAVSKSPSPTLTDERLMLLLVEIADRVKQSTIR